MTTDRDCWETPQSLVDAVAAILGGPPLVDLCASKDNAKARYYVSKGGYIMDADDTRDPRTRGSNGLFEIPPKDIVGWVANFDEFSWAWMNPPYSRGNIDKFTAWAADYARAGGNVAVLTPASFSDGWFVRNIAPMASRYLLPTKRVQFVPPKGIQGGRPNGHHVVSILQPLHCHNHIGTQVQHFDWRGRGAL